MDRLRDSFTWMGSPQRLGQIRARSGKHSSCIARHVGFKSHLSLGLEIRDSWWLWCGLHLPHPPRRSPRQSEVKSAYASSRCTLHVLSHITLPLHLPRIIISTRGRLRSALWQQVRLHSKPRDPGRAGTPLCGLPRSPRAATRITAARAPPSRCRCGSACCRCG